MRVRYADHEEVISAGEVCHAAAEAGTVLTEFGLKDGSRELPRIDEQNVARMKKDGVLPLPCRPMRVT
ncbi:MAG TPA: hypothetical protein PKM41_09670 [Deltaproteobacteria bacterium]|nr:hypothetical protein [Deltaproteobacteria bacterium]HOI07748.1 hypothetical protein [Deltaproteobacteria bacterium]